jgi:alpha-tubulin suppressor-like RCC1 family protein
MKTGYAPMTYAQLTATNRPSLTAFPLGTFVQDNVYTGIGTLDKYNGRYCVTPEYPRGTYAYFITQKNGIPTYPYIIGNEFYGSTDFYTAIDPNTGAVVRPKGPTYVTVVKQDQRVYNDIVSTGNNKDGQLVYGNLATPYSTSFSTISFKKVNWTKISAGYDHILALSGTKLYVGGKNTGGQIGQGSFVLQSKLTNIPGNYTDIAAGPQISFALSGQDLYGTGSNINYQLGNAKLNRTTTLYNFAFLGTEFKKVAVGGEHALAIKFNNRLYSTGRNTFGQLGDGDIYGATVLKTTFTQNRDSRAWSSIACGYYHSLAITVDKELFVAGKNDYGQLGTGNNNTYGTLYKISGAWDKVVCGKNSSYGLQGTDLYVTGDNQYGQLGLKNVDNTNIWTKIPGSFKDVAAGNYHALAISTNNILYVTGYNFSGELGLGDKVRYTSWTPINVPPLDGVWNLISAGNQTSYASISSTYFVEITATEIQS